MAEVRPGGYHANFHCAFVTTLSKSFVVGIVSAFLTLAVALPPPWFIGKNEPFLLLRGK